MKNRALFSALVLAFALAACESNPFRTLGFGADLECNGSNLCKVEVAVAGCAAGGTQISVDFPTVGVTKGKHDVDIKWHLAGNDYEFPEGAVKFKAGGAGQFDLPTGNKNNYKWRDHNTAAGKHEYSITVVKKGGAPCATKDPFIINDY